jgi:hypothetical protein
VSCDRYSLRPFSRRLTGLTGIWREYVSVPIVDLSYQGFETEFKSAWHLYLSFGFKAAAPISHNPIQGTSFLGRTL